MTNLTKWSIVATIAASLVGLAVIFLGSAWKQKEIPDMIESDTISPSAIPALDGAAPANTETATFALG
ncbi:MAG: hypothetical protein U9R15_08240 [Chloroflexota bacterium]|nr:hypothetical protein [Chloroflexota bacterium]